MLFSYKQLSNIVDLTSVSPEELRKRLTFSGFEVEGMEKRAQATNLVIGHILTCEKHPDSDHLHLLTVDCGKDEGIKNIVCGAPNARKDLNVIVALPGAVLPAKGITIEKGVIRGQESDGMCCSLEELGVDKSILTDSQLAGIEELPADAKIGERDVLGYLGLDDTILDVNVLPNRPDCLSYIGLAREISSLLSLKMTTIPDFSAKLYPSLVEVESLTESCPRIDILSLSELDSFEKTPADVVSTLNSAGIRSISPIVDLGNYVMLLTGEPFNMYDADKKTERHYKVISDYSGDFTAFDGKKLALLPNDIVITDNDKTVCLAGICSGEGQMVSKDTKSVDIEAAVFYHANIRKTCNRLGISSPSAQLFSKERNPLLINESLAVLISLLPKFFRHFVISGYSSFNSVDQSRISFEFSLDKLNHRLGSSYTVGEVDKVLQAYRIMKKDNLLFPPIDRVDLLEQCDIEEEVFRYYGYEKINPSLVNFPLTLGGLNPAQDRKKKIGELLIGKGFDQILSFTLIDREMDEKIRVFSKDPAYRIKNPMTSDHEYVRTDLLTSMLSVISYNLSHQHENMKLFEISPIDTPKGNHLYLSLALVGKRKLTEDYQEVSYSFFDMKGIIESIMERLGIAKTRYRLSYSQNPSFIPLASADIYLGRDLVGTIGKIHPDVDKNETVLGELDLGYLVNLVTNKTLFHSFSLYPEVKRDLSFLMKDEVTYEKLKKTIMQTKNAFVKDVSLFDYFQDDKKDTYIGVSLTLGKEDGTLKDSEISLAVETVKSEVKTQLGLTLRGE